MRSPRTQIFKSTKACDFALCLLGWPLQLGKPDPMASAEGDGNVPYPDLRPASSAEVRGKVISARKIDQLSRNPARFRASI
jgi:hypothetical protein